MTVLTVPVLFLGRCELIKMSFENVDGKCSKNQKNGVENYLFISNGVFKIFMNHKFLTE